MLQNKQRLTPKKLKMSFYCLTVLLYYEKNRKGFTERSKNPKHRKTNQKEVDKKHIHIQGSIFKILIKQLFSYTNIA